MVKATDSISPTFSMYGFDLSTLWNDNVDKWTTYLKISIATLLAYFISSNIIIQFVSLILSKLILDVLHFYIFEVKLKNDKN